LTTLSRRMRGGTHERPRIRLASLIAGH
jgi:hypothetical protein